MDINPILPRRPTTQNEVVSDDLMRIYDALGREMSAMAGKHLLVVGGAGFLGYYLVQFPLFYNLLSGLAPIRVTVYDNFSRGVPAWLTKLAEANAHLTLVRHDITSPLPADIPNFDYVIHAASIASPVYYRMHPVETMDANVTGLRVLLDYALRQKKAGRALSGFLFFSTSEIYGDPDPANIPTPETYRGNVSCTGPRACYDESKRYGETLCVNFAAQYGIPVTIARPFNNYGPGLKITDKRVLPDFARDVYEGRDIVMLSDGSPTRTFCYISDAIEGYYRILLLGRPGESYNIGTESPEISMADLAERVADLGTHLNDYQGKVIRKESPDKAYLTDNPNRRCPVIQKARTELGYSPKVSLEDGLYLAMVWYRENQTGEDA